MPDGDIYEGNFSKGIKTGEGIEYFKNGDKYVGEYLGNKFHGKGKLSSYHRKILLLFFLDNHKIIVYPFNRFETWSALNPIT